MQERAQIEVKVWGDFALFTRPELKVERMTYPVMTPSAARGVLEAIFWKPEFRYEIRQIGVLKQGSEMALLRNELSDRQGQSPIRVEDKRQQRTSVVLRDVAYLIRAEMALRLWATDPIYKYSDQFKRRVERGQCHHTPYLGTREFAASFGPPNGDTPQPLDMDVGPVLFEIAYVESAERKELRFGKHGPGGRREAWGYSQTLIFNARCEQGWLSVPPEKYSEISEMEAAGV
ncbi:MAG: type I-C CRISPR-associated protein Cas5c [Dehalococcoidia bacterium]